MATSFLLTLGAYFFLKIRKYSKVLVQNYYLQ